MSCTVFYRRLSELFGHGRVRALRNMRGLCGTDRDPTAGLSFEADLSLESIESLR